MWFVGVLSSRSFYTFLSYIVHRPSSIIYRLLSVVYRIASLSCRLSHQRLSMFVRYLAVPSVVDICQSHCSPAKSTGRGDVYKQRSSRDIGVLLSCYATSLSIARVIVAVIHLVVHLVFYRVLISLSIASSSCCLSHCVVILSSSCRLSHQHLSMFVRYLAVPSVIDICQSHCSPAKSTGRGDVYKQRTRRFISRHWSVFQLHIIAVSGIWVHVSWVCVQSERDLETLRHHRSTMKGPLWWKGRECGSVIRQRSRDRFLLYLNSSYPAIEIEQSPPSAHPA